MPLIYLIHVHPPSTVSAVMQVMDSFFTCVEVVYICKSYTCFNCTRNIASNR